MNIIKKRKEKKSIIYVNYHNFYIIKGEDISHKYSLKNNKAYRITCNEYENIVILFIKNSLKMDWIIESILGINGFNLKLKNKQKDIKRN